MYEMVEFMYEMHWRESQLIPANTFVNFKLEHGALLTEHAHKNLFIHLYIIAPDRIGIATIISVQIIKPNVV